MGRPREVRRPAAARAASSLHTTAGDYARFLRAVLDGKGLSSSQWADMARAQAAAAADCVVCVGRPAGAESRAHPTSANVHDSLGEAYLAAGRKAEALASYRRSLALDPTNGNARQAIDRLSKA